MAIRSALRFLEPASVLWLGELQIDVVEIPLGPVFPDSPEILDSAAGYAEISAGRVEFVTVPFAAMNSTSWRQVGLFDPADFAEEREVDFHPD